MNMYSKELSGYICGVLKIYTVPSEAEEKYYLYQEN
jgi:hypothetical protein